MEEEVEMYGQIVDSMLDVLKKFEKAQKKQDLQEMKRMKGFLLKLYIELSEVLDGKA